MSRNDPLASLVVSVRASADQFTADMKKVQASSTNTTNAIVASWGKSGDAASEAVRKMEQRAASKTILNNVTATTTGITKGWAKTADAAQNAAVTTQRSFDRAGATMNSLEQMLGVNLPSAASKFLETSKTIGPILSTAFSAVAVLGFIQVLMQLPALFDKIAGAITGWDEAAQKAYSKFLENNKKAVEAAEEFRLKMIEIQFGKVASISDALQKVRGELQKNQTEWENVTRKIKEQRDLVGEDLAQWTAATQIAQAKDLLGLLEAGRTKETELNRELQKEEAQIRKKATDDAIAEQKRLVQESQRAAKQVQERAQDIIRANQATLLKVGEDIQTGMSAGIKAMTDTFVDSQKTIDRILAKNRADMGEHGEQVYKDGVKWIDAQSDAFVKGLDKQIKASGETVERIDKFWDDAGDKLQKQWNDQAEAWQRVWENAMGNAVSDFASGFADMLFEGESFVKSMTAMFKNLAKSIIQIMVTDAFSKVARGFSGMLGGLGGAAGGGAGGAIGTLNPATGALVSGGAGAGGGAAGFSFAGFSGAQLGAFFTNPFTIAAAAGIIGTTAWLKSQAHHEANTFVQKFQNPFQAELDKILKSSTTVSEKLKDVDEAWGNFSDAATQFAQGGKDEALVVKQAVQTLSSVVDRIKTDLGGLPPTWRLPQTSLALSASRRLEHVVGITIDEFNFQGIDINDISVREQIIPKITTALQTGIRGTREQWTQILNNPVKGITSAVPA